MHTADFIEKAKLIKLIIFDVDGVFTDGQIYVDDRGIEIKAFHVLDGQGIKLLQKSNIQIAIISGREAPGVAIRMQQLGIRHIYLGHTNKIPVYEDLLQTMELADEEVAYAGDDFPDLPLLRRVGLPITVPDAVPEIKQCVKWVTTAKGGKGAVREICEHLLRAQGVWDEVIKAYQR